jgi:hypothetical protein
MTTKQPPSSNCAGCGAPLLERNRYFTGKFMTARDFQGEQDYIRSRQQLHNRMLHGWGIVAGLEIRPNPSKECRSTTVVVKAGMALDCCGREVILPADLVYEVPRPAPAGNGIEDQYKKEVREQRLLCICFGEQQIELVPSIYDETDAGANTEEANRIRETPTFRLLRLDQVSELCWKGGAHSGRCRDDCEDQIPGPAGTLLDPDCPCGSSVPLALLSYRLDVNDDAIEIHQGGRRRLPINADLLTHIVETNWAHAGMMTLHHLREKLDGRLEIRFDRKIRPATENLGAGVSEYTFLVQFGGVQEDIRYLPYDPDRPPELKDDCVAVFHIDPRYLEHNRRDDLKDKVIYVTLKCDFIMDCRGVPVDGAFLRGELPTHGGRMGGTFESWFVIEEAEEIERERPEGSRNAGRRPRSSRRDEQ